MSTSTPKLRHYWDHDAQRWIRATLVIVGLLLVAVVAFLASQNQLALVLLLPVGAGLCLMFLRWPPAGLIVAFSAGLVVPFLGPSGLNVTMILIALLLGLWLLDMMARPRQTRLARSRTLWPLLFFLVAAAFSFGFGQLPWLTFARHAPLGAQLGGMSVMVLSAGSFLLAANQIRNLRWLSRITWAFVAIGALSVFVRSLLPELGLPTRDLFQPAGSVFYIWLVAIAFSQAVFNGDLHRGWRFALGGVALATFSVLFFMKFGDKSGWLSVLVCVAAIIGARSWLAGFALVPVAAVSALYSESGLAAAEAYSISTRTDAWSIILQIAKISPIWGLGFANYYWYTPLFPIRGYAVSFNSHNNYVDIIAQMGLLGLVGFLWLLWEIGRLGWRLRKQAPAGFARAYAYGALGGLAGMVVVGMFGDWVLPFFYNVGLLGFRTSMVGWIFLGGLVSLEQIVMSPASAAAEK